MKLTEDGIRVRKLEAKLTEERQQRIELPQKVSGVNSLNTRLKVALLARKEV
jgi:hypothetical protein